MRLYARVSYLFDNRSFVLTTIDDKKLLISKDLHANDEHSRRQENGYANYRNL